MTGPWAPLDETKRAMLRAVVRANIKCFMSRLLLFGSERQSSCTTRTPCERPARPRPLDRGVEELKGRLAPLRDDLRRRRRQQLPVALALRRHPQAGRNLGNALLHGDDRLQWRGHPVARRGQITQVVTPAGLDVAERNDAERLVIRDHALRLETTLPHRHRAFAT